MKLFLCLFLLLGLVVDISQSQPPLVVHGAGATFPEGVYYAWSDSYVAERPDIEITYNATGSGLGQSLIINGSVVFAGSDSPLKDSQYATVPDLQLLPFLAGGIVPFTKSFDTQLTMSRELVANIFLNNIKFWDDPEIKALNPNVNFPHVSIKIIYRKDSSGTTNSFTTALSKFSVEWKERFGAAQTWPAALINQTDVYYPAVGNDGAFTLSSIIPYSISYISYTFAYTSLSDQYCVKMINLANNTLVVNAESVTAATEGAIFNDRFASDITDSPNSNAWPISTFTYIIVRLSSTNVTMCDEFTQSLNWLNYAIKYYAPNLLVGLNGMAPSSSSIRANILQIMGTITCNGENVYNPDSQALPAPSPPTYYYDRLQPYSTIDEVSYSKYYNDIGSVIDANSAKEYEPSTISSLFSSNIVYENYYDKNQRQSSDSSQMKVNFSLSLILLLVFSSLSKSTKSFLLMIFITIYLAYSVNGEITDLRIAGLFPFTGYLSEYGSSEEAAARIAVNDLNSSFLPSFNYTLSFQSYDTRSSPSGSTQSLITARTYFNMFGIIGCHDPFASSSVALSSSLYYFPQISYGSRANFLSSPSEYPYFARVIPPYRSEGRAIASLIKLYDWDKVGLIITSDDYGTDTANEFRQQFNQTEITFVQFSPGEEELDAQMSVLRNALVRVIVLFAGSSADSATVLKEADRYHLIGDDFVWFGGSFISTSDLFYNQTSEETNKLVKSLAVGITSVKLKGGFGEKYNSFLDIWSQLNPEIYSGSGKKSIPIYGAYSYDAVELFVRTFVKSPLATLPQFMVNLGNTTFDGLTGPVNLNFTTDRLAIYDVVNLHDSNEGDKGFVVIGDWFEENANSSSNGFNFEYDIVFHSGSTEPPQPEVRPKVEYWICADREMKTDETGKIRLDAPGPDAKNIAAHYYCDNFMDCHNFSDESGDCASNYTAVFIVFGIITGILIIISFLLIPITIILGVVVKVVRVRTASPPFLTILLISIIVGYGSIYAWFGQPNAVACGFQPWLLGLAVNSMIAVLVAKNYRIWRIFRNPLKKKNIRDVEVYLLWVILMVPAVFILFLWTLISTPTALLTEVADDPHWVCDTGGFTGPPGGIVFFFIFVGYSGIVLLIGAIVSFAIRKVPSLFNESRLIAISIYNILFLAVIIIPIFFVLLKFNPFIGWIIRTLAILYAFTTTLCLMFVPKVIGSLRDLYRGEANVTSTNINTTTSNSLDSRLSTTIS